MRLFSAFSALSALSALSAVSAQSLTSRVANAPDGVVRMEVESRMGVCGDGRDLVGYKSAVFAHNFQSIGGHWDSDRCAAGPLRVTLTVADGQVTRSEERRVGE